MVATASTTLGTACNKCGASAFTTTWQTFKNGARHLRMTCAQCRTFQRYLPQGDGDDSAFRHQHRTVDADHPSMQRIGASWRWVGMVRGIDHVWRPVAVAPTLERCWDCLLSSWQGDAELLAMPVRQEAKPQ